MNIGRIYVPNPQKWVRYYQNMSNGNHNPYVTRMQTGSGLGSTGGVISNSSSTFMIPIENNEHVKRPHSMDKINVEMVSPAQQTVEQANDELRRSKSIKRKKSIKHNQSKNRLSAKRTSTKQQSKSKKLKSKKLKRNKGLKTKRPQKQKSTKISKKKRFSDDIFT